MILDDFPLMVNTVINVGIVWWPMKYHTKWQLPDCGNGGLEYPEGYGNECSEYLEQNGGECSEYSIAVRVQNA